MKNKFDYGISVVVMIFSAWIFFATKDFAKYYSGAPGSGFWPRIIAGGLLVLAVWLAVDTYIKNKNQRKDEEKPETTNLIANKKRIYLMFGVMVLVGLSIKFLGFIPTSLWFVCAVMLIMEEKHWKMLVITSAAITASVYVIFTYFLKMMLPSGTLFM